MAKQWEGMTGAWFEKAGFLAAGREMPPPPCQKKEFSSWGWGMNQLPEIRPPTCFPMFFLIIAQITICTRTRCLLIKAN